MEKKSIAFKTEPVVKEGIEQLLVCFKLTQGDVIHKLVKEALQSSMYNRYLEKAIKKWGLNFNCIIHDTATLEAEEIFKSLEEIKEEFYFEYDLEQYEQFEDISLEQISISMIENSGLSGDWIGFLETKLIDKIVDQLNQVAVNHLGISGELLLLAKPELNTKITVHAKALIDIYTRSHDTKMASVIVILTYLNGEKNSISPMWNFSLMTNLNKITNEKEKRWLYTLYHSYSIHFINKNPGFEESIKFFEEELNSDKYPIYEEVEVPIMIKKF